MGSNVEQADKYQDRYDTKGAQALMRRVCVKAYLMPAEKTRLETLAGKVRISGSELVRRLIMGARLPDRHNSDMIRDLLKINADLARLGNLLKLGIDEGNLTHDSAMDLMTEIRIRQGEIKLLVTNIATGTKKGKRNG